ncbi:phage portal protein [Micrococcus luteus]|uniref:phage portal protein n=1 Tax=Micrococcus luteus TaxID=1270 RepID=UPI003318E8E2
MGLLDKVAAVQRGRAQPARKSWAEPAFWDLDRMRWPWLGGSSLRPDREQIENDFQGYVDRVYKANGPIFSLMLVRMAVFSEARFLFRRLRGGRAGDLFGTGALAPLEVPWPGGTTGDLLSRMIQDADLAGNAFATFYRGRIRRMRPDRVTIVLGSQSRPDLTIPAGTLPLDAEVIGYFYSPSVYGADDDVLLLPSQVAHFAPVPDPSAQHRGMSWLTPVLREISSDLAATRHKMSFFENSATPRLAVKLDSSVTPEMFKRFRALMEESHQGVDRAYSTLYLGGGADVAPLTMSLRDLDYRAVQGAGETRLASAAGVPPVIAGFSEGLAGSSLNAGNYGAAKRRFIDGTMRPLWRGIAGALAPLVTVPGDAQLWIDDRDIAFLREDARDRADVQGTKANTVRQLVDAGYTADSVVAAVEAEDLSLLKHSGLFSVQLQPPGTAADQPPEGGVPDPPADPAEEQ